LWILRNRRFGVESRQRKQKIAHRKQLVWRFKTLVVK